jgi:hypothetical protein
MLNEFVISCIDMHPSSIGKKWKNASTGHRYSCIQIKQTGANSRMEKAVKSKNELGLPGLVYKFEMICLWGT